MLARRPLAVDARRPARERHRRRARHSSRRRGAERSRRGRRLRPLRRHADRIGEHGPSDARRPSPDVTVDTRSGHRALRRHRRRRRPAPRRRAGPAARSSSSPTARTSRACTRSTTRSAPRSARARRSTRSGSAARRSPRPRCASSRRETGGTYRAGVERDASLPRSTRRSSASSRAPGRSATTRASRPGDTLHLYAQRPGRRQPRTTVGARCPARATRSGGRTPSSLIPSFGYSAAGTLAISVLAGSARAARVPLLVRRAPGLVGEGAPRAAPRRRARSRQDAPPARAGGHAHAGSPTRSSGLFANVKQFRAVAADDRARRPAAARRRAVYDLRRLRRSFVGLVRRGRRCLAARRADRDGHRRSRCRSLFVSLQGDGRA